MNDAPMWRLLHEGALKLTRSGHAPFTRTDLIACVRGTVPNAMANSINPIIQGITDNLKGGAPGSDGKRILHSVGRGRFVLRIEYEQEINRLSSDSFNSEVGTSGDSTVTYTDLQLPNSEKELQNIVLSLLREQLINTDCLVEAEIRIPYRLPSGKELRHASDILVSTPSSAKQVSIEIKYRSAVTDQFKCRAYDAIHIKQQFGDKILTVMLFARDDSGISIEHAHDICYSFDRFYGDDAPRFLRDRGINELVADIRQFLFSEQ